MMELLVRGVSGADVKALRKALVKALAEAAAGFPGLAQGDTFDAVLEAALRRWQAGVGAIADGVAGPRCQMLLGLRQPAPMALDVRTEAVRQLFPATKPANVERYLPYVVAALQALGLTDRPMVLAALGTIRAESEGFLPIAEFPSHFNTLPGGAPFSAHEGPSSDLGNSQPGDGAKFKGRGFVPLTGRANYTRYGKQLGIDLVGNPDWANAPEVAAVLLASFLADKAEAMRVALKAGDFRAARKQINDVNGGVQGLDRFIQVFESAQYVWPAVRSSAARSTKGGKVVRQASAKRPLTARKDTPDLRDRPYQPPPVSLLDRFPTDADIATLLPRYARAGLIRNQGAEGACTGFGLACVVNHLRWRKAGMPAKFESVSPRMLYTFARRYDEYSGEDYEGSSCRGALKGWFHHGVCNEADWPYDEVNGSRRYGYAQRAAAISLGVYFRVELRAITDLQAAIQQVGAVFVSAYTHAGWDALKGARKVPKGHDDLPMIAFDGRPSETDGHAFALVGFNSRGFVIQNSWGTGFGRGGFAVLSYADWLANGMDAWVAALGVPGVLAGRISASTGAAAAHTRAAKAVPWWDETQAYAHSVVLGDDGRVQRYLTEDEPNRNLLHQVVNLPMQWFQTQGASASKRLVIYAHGGLNSERAAVQRARAMGRHFVGNGCYPLFIVWKTGVLETIVNLLRGAAEPPKVAGMGEWLTDKSDLLIEKSIGRVAVRPVWNEMKQNAELAFDSSRGGDLLINALSQLAGLCAGQLEVHLVGHSAGSIWLGHLLSALAARAKLGTVRSVHLYAPACSLAFANRHFAPHADLMRQLHIDLLSDRLERNDNTGLLYRKSLLYLVSQALETDLRTPLLGLAKAFDAAYTGWDGSSATGNALRDWRSAAAQAGLQLGSARLQLLDADQTPTALSPPHDTTTNHGSFDNNLIVVTRTLERITGGKLKNPVDDLRGF